MVSLICRWGGSQANFRYCVSLGEKGIRSTRITSAEHGSFWSPSSFRSSIAMRLPVIFGLIVVCCISSVLSDHSKKYASSDTAVDEAKRIERKGRGDTKYHLQQPTVKNKKFRVTTSVPVVAGPNITQLSSHFYTKRCNYLMIIARAHYAS